MPLALSAVIITKNAAQQLPACLASLHFVDDIVVVDSGSTDGTQAIASAAGARVLHQDWLGFGPQKQFAVTQARHDWVLCVDADERVSDALRLALEQELQAPAHQVYCMPRCNRFLGRWLRHGEGYPDWSTRVFHRQHARWSDDSVHETVLTTALIGHLRGDLLHESAETLASYLHKQNSYTSLQAEILAGRGKRVRLAQLVLAPVVRFIKFYVLRRGFLDGSAGFIHIVAGCCNSFFKYAKLLEIQGRKQAARRSDGPP